MADQDLNIHIKALDETAGALGSIQAATMNISKGFHEAGRSMTMMGREIGQIGSAMVMMGTAITAPMVLAFNTAAKFSPQIKQQISDITDQWDKMAVSVGQSMIPVVEQFTQTLNKVVGSWTSLSQATRDNLVQTTLAAGGYLLYGGVAVKALGETLRVGGDILKLFGGMFATISAVSGAFSILAGAQVIVADGNILIGSTAAAAAGKMIMISLPVVATVAAVGLLIAAMAKWQSVNDTVISAAEVVWKAFWNILISVKLGFTGLAEVAIDAIEAIVSAAAKLTNLPWLKSMQSGIDKIRQSLQGMASNDLAGIGKQMGAINTIVTTGQGDWSTGIDKWKLSLDQGTTSAVNFGTQAANAFTKAAMALKTLQGGVGSGGASGGSAGGNSPIETWLDGLKAGLNTNTIAINQWALNFEKVGQGVANDLQSSLGNFFDNVFTGQVKKAEQFFADFGQSLLKTFANAIAQMITQWIMFGAITKGTPGSAMGGVMGLFGMKFHSGGVVPYFHDGGPVGSSWANPVVAHDGLAVDEVPAVLQSGEGVLSRDGMQNLAQLNKGGKMNGGKGLTIQITPVVQAWDASDVQRNMTAITNAIGSNLMQNGQLRTLMRQYQ